MAARISKIVYKCFRLILLHFQFRKSGKTQILKQTFTVAGFSAMFVSEKSTLFQDRVTLFYLNQRENQLFMQKS